MLFAKNRESKFFSQIIFSSSLNVSTQNFQDSADAHDNVPPYSTLFMMMLHPINLFHTYLWISLRE